MSQWSEWRPRADLNVDDVDGEIVILDRARNEVHQLNQAASVVWSGISADEIIDPEALSAHLSVAFGVKAESVGDDVESLLQEFCDLGLLDQTA
jgi:hypothetical protein